MEQKEYVFSDEIGDAAVTVYEVFPGVQLAYHSVHMDRLELGFGAEGDLIEIHHCREGRVEQEFEDAFFYLMPGDLSVAMRTEMVSAYHFPLRHYHGITIGIRVDAVSEVFLRMLREINVQPLETAQKLCGDKSCFIIRSDRYVEHIFSELYTVSERIREGYLKVKILELFLVLSGIDPYRNQLPACALPRAHVRLANQAAAYLSEHMGRHITIPELSRRFGVSDTLLKNAFKGVYGVPIFSYMRIRKMQAAAQLLIQTEKPVAVISDEFGYTNTSKFSTAFQAVMGETPSEYRRAHTKHGSR